MSTCACLPTTCNRRCAHQRCWTPLRDVPPPRAPRRSSRPAPDDPPSPACRTRHRPAHLRPLCERRPERRPRPATPLAQPIAARDGSRTSHSAIANGGVPRVSVRSRARSSSPSCTARMRAPATVALDTACCRGGSPHSAHPRCRAVQALGLLAQQRPCSTWPSRTTRKGQSQCQSFRPRQICAGRWTARWLCATLVRWFDQEPHATSSPRRCTSHTALGS